MLPLRSQIQQIRAKYGPGRFWNHLTVTILPLVHFPKTDFQVELSLDCVIHMYMHIFTLIRFVMDAKIWLLMLTCHVSCLTALQKEQEILEAISPSSAVKTLQPLESVLANMKFVSTAPSSVTTSKRDVSTLTADAARVIQRLPDLSFMHATVLMFPIKGDQ